MAVKRKKKKGSSSRKKTGAGFGQKFLVAASLVVLVLCAASVTSSFYFRQKGQPRTFTIEVLNGSGKTGLAHAARNGLLHLGIDVIKEDNAPHFGYEESILIARKPDADVDLLGEILGCKNVIVQIQEDNLADATLILGADYRELNLEWERD
ncbi:MAG: LytR C-terminal domain-containing protein [Candidatus Krumholzibacteria bacterium]|nr:LytR C-terminal domain-containing protein [Candidatus Krumholzibacteria bacterium]